MKIWKLIGAFILIPILCAVIPMGLAHFSLIAPLQAKAGMLLAVTAFGLCVKIICSDLATGDFDYHKHGHDFCVLTMGGALPAGSLQLASNHDLFPGIANAWPWNHLSVLTTNVIHQRLFVILTIFALSSLFAFLTARVSRAVKEEKPKYSNLLSIFNFGAGSTLFASYLLLLLTKE